MRLKWAKNDGGSILNDPVLSPEANLKFEQTQMQMLRHLNEYGEDEDDDCESSRLHDDDSDTTSLYPSASPKFSVYKGILYSSLSSLFFSLCSAIVKYLDDIHPGELAVFRFVGILVLTIPLLIRNGQNPLGPPHLRHYLVLRGIAGATSLYLRFYAFRYLPIADASVIIFSVPVFVSIFACIFLKEPCGFFQILSVCLTMIGLGLTTKLPVLFGGAITQSYQEVMNASTTLLLNDTQIGKALAVALPTSSAPALSADHMYGVLAAVSSTFFAASVYIVVRKAKSAHYTVIMFNFGWVACIETLVITFLLDGFSLPKHNWEWFYILALGLFSFFGQVLLTRSLQLEAAGPVSVVRAATDIALAFVWQLWLFNEIPDIWSISGALIVTLCVLLTSVRKWLLTLPEHSLIRQKLGLLT